MSRGGGPIVACPLRFPRVSGDELFQDMGHSLDGLFSPRERG